MALPDAPTPAAPPGLAGAALRAYAWGAEALWESMEPLLPGLTVEAVERIDSTNTELCERLRRASRLTGRREGGGRSEDLQPQLLVATQQTAGRGRMGRHWQAVPGASLTFSLAVSLARPDWSGLSLAVGLALADALDPGGRRLGLKWPNDVLLCEPGKGIGRKLGGILIESVPVGSHRVAVVGVGLNVLPAAADGDPAAFACLAEADPAATARGTLAIVGPALARALAAFDRDGFTPCVEAFGRRDVLRGRLVTTTDPAMPEGVAAGVDADGALRLVAGHTTHRVISGEISVRPAPAR